MISVFSPAGREEAEAVGACQGAGEDLSEINGVQETESLMLVRRQKQVCQGSAGGRRRSLSELVRAGIWLVKKSSISKSFVDGL